MTFFILRRLKTKITDYSQVTTQSHKLIVKNSGYRGRSIKQANLTEAIQLGRINKINVTVIGK